MAREQPVGPMSAAHPPQSFVESGFGQIAESPVHGGEPMTWFDPSLSLRSLVCYVRYSPQELKSTGSAAATHARDSLRAFERSALGWKSNVRFEPGRVLAEW